MRKSLKQVLIYYSPDGTLGGAAHRIGVSRQTISNVVSGKPVSRVTAQAISDFVENKYTQAELMGVSDDKN